MTLALPLLAESCGIEPVMTSARVTISWLWLLAAMHVFPGTHGTAAPPHNTADRSDPVAEVHRLEPSGEDVRDSGPPQCMTRRTGTVFPATAILPDLEDFGELSRLPDMGHAPRFDLHGNIVEHAVGEYRIGASGRQYESHAPATAQSPLGAPIG